MWERLFSFAWYYFVRNYRYSLFNVHVFILFRENVTLARPLTENSFTSVVCSDKLMTTTREDHRSVRSRRSTGPTSKTSVFLKTTSSKTTQKIVSPSFSSEKCLLVFPGTRIMLQAHLQSTVSVYIVLALQPCPVSTIFQITQRPLTISFLTKKRGKIFMGVGTFSVRVVAQFTLPI